MRSTFALSIEGLYVHNFKIKFIVSPTNPYHEKIKTWRRYIDYIFVIGEGDKEVLSLFLWLNYQDEFFKFTYRTSEEEVTFLDV